MTLHSRLDGLHLHAPPLESGSVQIWRINLPHRLPPQCLEHLSEEELTRYHRLIPPEKKCQFACARHALRQILAYHMGVDPRSIVFECGPDGKPGLARGLLEIAPIAFNVSHSGELAVCALVLGQAIGIDLERIDPDRPFLTLARRFFAAEEIAQLAAVAPEALPLAFYRCWTAKEAYVKAVGRGLLLPLDSFAVDLGYDRPPALLRSAQNDAENWKFYPFTPKEAFVATLVFQGAVRDVSVIEFPSPAG